METATETLDALTSGIDVKITDPSVDHWSGHYEISQEAAKALETCCSGSVENADRGDIQEAAMVLMKYETVVLDATDEDAIGEDFAEASDAMRAVSLAETLDGTINVNE